MKRMEHMRTTSKANYIQRKVRSKGSGYVSEDWIKWAKKYLNRNSRRKLSGLDQKDVW